MLARRVNTNTVVLTSSNLKELSRVLTVLRYSKIRFRVRSNKLTKNIDVYIKIYDDMDLAIIKSIISIIDDKEAQIISKHCLIVAEEFKKNPLLRAIASYS